ncbi:hypothetical protein StoSoilB13_47690 (plasmid) [Arthrobacter sp. StoSoilB13]|nr:hypothetical protein StoSoilB13_47690 [Arthrobacter sp. StoSoilB13]
MCQLASTHDGYLVGKGKGFGLVVGYEDGCNAGRVEHVGHCPPGGYPESGVECGERLVQQHELGFAGQGTRQGDALLLPAGQLVRPPLCHGRIQRHHFEQLLDAGRYSPPSAVELSRIQSKSDVLSHGQMREKSPILGDVSHLPFVRGEPHAIARNR